MNSWKTQKSQIIHENAWFKIYKDAVTTPANKSGEYTYVENHPYVLIVGAHKKGLVMVCQYRYPLKQVVTEFPAGSLEDGETPLAAAKREFKEESGYLAASWIELGPVLEMVSTNCARGTIFLAQNLTDTKQHQRLEEGISDMLLVSPAEIEEQIVSGVISDAKTVAAYLRAKLYLEQHPVSV